MLEPIKQLLVLQDRDRNILRLRAELANIGPECRALQAKAANSRSSLEAASLKIKQIESERKKLELEVEAKKQLIERYSLQQFQTKKNDEYRALAHEIELCRTDIVQLDDQQLELMEQAEAAQKELAAVSQAAIEVEKTVAEQIADLGERETNFERQLTELESERSQLAQAADETYRRRYERLLKSKGENVVVGIEHGVCGGCHVRLTAQTVVSCQGEDDLVTCINCGRILYYTPTMDLTVAE
jgi:uncharacterized protein